MADSPYDSRDQQWAQPWGVDWKEFPLSRLPDDWAEKLHARGDISGVDEVWHYTSAAGLVGIIEANELWLSGIDQLNDPVEGKYGFDILRATWEEVASAIAPLAAYDAIEAALEGETGVIGQNQLHVLSASRNPDSLPLWTHYGQSQGFAIGFATTGFADPQIVGPGRDADAILHRNFPRFQWAPVIYSPDQQRTFALAILGLLVLALQSYEERPDDPVTPDTPIELQKALVLGRAFGWIAMVAYFLRLFAATVKHPAYRHEEEIRLLVDYADPSELKYREMSGRAVPYIRLGTKAPGGLPIIGVRCGPMVPPHTVPVIESLLMTAGRREVPVTISEVPYRG